MTIKQLKAKERNLESGSRQQILDVALKLFAHKGYAAATVREIVDTRYVVCVGRVEFFFFKQKTAYEMLRGLVGSEMCIRDRVWGALPTWRWRRCRASHCRVTCRRVPGSTAPTS